MNALDFLRGITRPGSQPFSNPIPHAPAGMRSRGRVAVVGPDGKIKQVGEWAENIANTYGLARLASIVGSSAGVNASTLVSAMKIGTGTTAATSTDAALSASVASVVITQASLTKTNSANRTVEYQATFASDNPSGAAQITEVGLYCNSTADSQLLARLVLTGAQSVNKGASDQILVSYDTVYITAP